MHACSTTAMTQTRVHHVYNEQVLVILSLIHIIYKVFWNPHSHHNVFTKWSMACCPKADILQCLNQFDVNICN